jgi:hypothetical protein
MRAKESNRTKQNNKTQMRQKQKKKNHWHVRPPGRVAAGLEPIAGPAQPQKSRRSTTELQRLGADTMTREFSG